jgi:hypothetical protein
MSHEIIHDPVVGLPRPRRAGGSGAHLPLPASPGPALDLEARSGCATRPLRSGSRSTRVSTPITLVTVALVALLAGAAVGDAHAGHAARTQLAAGTRVLLWADATEVPGDGVGEPESVGLSALPVSLVVTGSPVTVSRLLFGVGEADASPALALRPGVRLSTDLVLRPDCAVLGRDGGHPAAFTQARAVVRLPGAAGLREVPLDVLGDPSAVLLSLLAPCADDSYRVG